MNNRYNLLGGLLLAVAAITAAAGERISTAADRTATRLIVYGDQALVRETRRVTLDRGENEVVFADVPAQMRTPTLLLESSAADALEVSLQADVLSPQKLLERYVGRNVTVIRTNPATGAEVREQATVLSAVNGVVLRFPDRIETGVPGRLAFDAVPAGLRDRPTLLARLAAERAGPADVSLSYLTGGLSWRTDYVAAVDNRNRMDLSAWVSVTNATDLAFQVPRLELVAGEPNRVRQAAPEMAMAMSRAAPAPQAFRDEAFSEYRRYTLDRPVALAPRETRQLALFSAHGVPVRYEYVLQGGDYYFRSPQPDAGRGLHPALFIAFDNRAPGLGRALPAGVARFYREGQFIGEDRVEHTANGESVRLRLGEVFEVTADRQQTVFRRLSEQAFESSYRIEIRNAKDQAVTVDVVEPVSGEWEVLKESLRHSREGANVARWRVPVPAGGKAVLEYTVRVR